MTLRVRQLTASGRGAVAVLNVSGSSPSEVSNTLARYFTAVNRLPLPDLPTHRILYGTWETEGTREDVIVVRNGAAEWEVCCHGGVAAIDRIRQCLTDLDIQSHEEQSDSLDDLLLQCPTVRTAEYILAHRRGLNTELAELTDRISTDELRLRLRRMLSFRRFATHLVKPWTVAIAGCPNAGKSSLLNAIIGYDRSIVFAQPGTTRDRVEASTVIDGWPYLLLDTAGVRDAADDQIESKGVSIAESTFASSDAALLVVDSTLGLQDVDSELLSSNPDGRPLAIVWNKTDLVGPKPPPDIGFPVVQISATQKSGVPDLLEWLAAATVGTPPALTELLPISDTLARAAQQFLDQQIDLGQLKTALLT